MPKILNLNDFSPLLTSPESKGTSPLTLNGESFSDGTLNFPLVDGLPILLPSKVHPYIKNGRIEIPLDKSLEKFIQYFLISSIKQNHPTINSDHNDYWYQRHMDNCKKLFTHAKEGLLLDIGCDTPSLNIKLHSQNIQYIGLDPSFTLTEEFRVIGIAELLPFKNESFDNVCLMSSLDHVLDYYQAFSEATRVLKKGGKMLFSILVWYKEADLFNDTNHFHHFRDEQIMNLFIDYKITFMFKDVWKNNTHRESLYLCAEKI